ncbi:MAG: siderophore-interacting protein [Paracoccaceae bacterium]
MSCITDTVIPTDQPGQILIAFEAHISGDHGLDLKSTKDGGRFIEHEAFRVDFKVQDTGLYVKIKGPNESALIFFKEEIAHHVAELDERAAGAIRWRGENSKPGDLPPNFRVLEVVKSKEIFRGMQRVTIKMPDRDDMLGQGLHVRLMLPSRPGRDPVWPRMGENGSPIWPQGDDKLHARYVTIKNVRADVAEIDLDIVRHAGGLISLWAQQAEPGQFIGAMGPAGMDQLPKATTYFLAADGTGLPAIARLLATIDQASKGSVVVAAPDDCDLQTYFPDTHLEVRCVDPDDFPEQIQAIAEEMTEPGRTEYAFFAGEFDNAQALRKHFKGMLGLGKERQLSTAYWRRGMAGFGS